MRSNYIAVYTILVFLQVIKLTNGELPKCDTTDKEKLECFTCSDSAPSSSKHCSNSTGAQLFTKWINSRELVDINTTRYYEYCK